MNCKNLFILGLLTGVLSCAAQAEESKIVDITLPQKVDEGQWLDLIDVGEHIIEQKQEILLLPAKASELFQKDELKIKPDWQEKLGQPIVSVENPDIVPDAIIQKQKILVDEGRKRFPDIKYVRDDEFQKNLVKPFIKVTGFSKIYVQVMILQWRNAWMWHHYEATLANFKIPRNEAIDELFGLKELDRTYLFRVKGVGYGSGVGEVIKALGKPDGIEHFQKSGMFCYFYLKDDLELLIDNGKVLLMTVGVPEWAKKEIKENGVNVVRRY